MRDAAYYRDYRARKRALRNTSDTVPIAQQEVAQQHEDPTVARLIARNAFLEDEVRRLKTELASRPAPIVGRSFNSRPFTPVPKVSRSR